MMPECVRLDNLDDLRHYVHSQLCHQNELEINAFRMTERILVRGDRPCGIYFCLHGPREVKVTAIWETDHNSILFYGETGERRARLSLHHAPQLALAES